MTSKTIKYTKTNIPKGREIILHDGTKLTYVKPLGKMHCVVIGKDGKLKNMPTSAILKCLNGEPEKQ